MADNKKKGTGLAKLGRLLVPSKKRAITRDRFIKAGFSEIPYKHLGAGFCAVIIFTLLWYLYVFVASNLLQYAIPFIIATFFLLIGIFGFILFFAAKIILWLYLEVKGYTRVQEIERNLPLFLRELATNLKAGREFVDGLEDSLTPQLGVLNDDIARIIVNIKSGKMVTKVLKDYAERYDSYAINETFEIILEAYEGGGGLSEIIDRIAENLEVIHYLKKNAIASVANYIIFTTIVALIIAPILFALSFNLLWLIKSLLDRLLVAGSTPGFLDIASKLDISFTDFKLFSRAGIAVISGSAASIIGIIRRGSLRGAPVIILLFILIALVAYEIAFWVLEWFFKVLFNL